MVFIKEEEGNYIFDPNYGLIACDPKNPEVDLLKLLSIYEPPEREADKRYKPNNYDLKLQKYELNGVAL
jgi:hypothetical protein